VLSIWVKSFDPSDSLWIETKAVSFVVENMMASGFSDFLLEGDALNVINVIFFFFLMSKCHQPN
jgi:hypothetical protein